MLFIALALVMLAFAPAPLPRPERHTPTWPIGMWEGTNYYTKAPIYLIFNRDGTYYEKCESSDSQGTWTYDPWNKNKVTAVTHSYNGNLYLTVEKRNNHTLHPTNWASNGPFYRVR